MKKWSLFKMLTAASISSVYVFLFTVVQIVDVSADNEMPLDIIIEEQSGEQTTSQTERVPETSVPSTTVSLLDMSKPGIADYSPRVPAQGFITSADSDRTYMSETSEIILPNIQVPPQTVNTSETEAPETDVPETDVPETDVPETDAPETDAPETDAPETDVPETDAPETDAPETDAPETDAPETDVPETDAPETDVPETDVPETSAPETDSTEIAPPEVVPETNGNENEYQEEMLTVYDMLTGTYYTAGAKEIVARAVVGEIWNAFPDEAVKAQAVATYTYIKKSNLQGRYPDTAMKTDVYDRIYRLVDEVLGEAIYYNGEMIQSVFFASSCGYTNSSLNAWGVDYPYLRSVDCPFDEATDPNWGSTRSYTSSEISAKVYSATGISLSGDPSQWFEIVSRLDNREHGWITSLSIGGYTSYNGRIIDGRTMRERILGYGIKSAAFDVSYDAATDSFTFTTYGHGHGVGMSQYGAAALAEAGYDYKQILKHYFTGVEIY